MCGAQQLKNYYDPDDLWREDRELNDQEIAALDLQGAASAMEEEGEISDMNAEQMTNEGFYMVKSLRRSLPGPAPAVPLPPVTPADLLRINDCISQNPQNPGSKSKNIENVILLQP